MILLQAVGRKCSRKCRWYLKDRERADLCHHTLNICRLYLKVCARHPVPVPFDLSLWALSAERWNRSFALRPPRSYQQADDVGFTKTQVRGRRQWINCAAKETLFPVNISIRVGGAVLNMLNSCLAEVPWKSALLPPVNVALAFSH